MAFPSHAPRNSTFVLVSEAGTDRGFALVQALLAAGNRVVAVDRLATGLVRIAHGHSSDQLLLIAADISDAAQAQQVIARAHAHFGEVTPTLALCADYRRSSAA
jgi:NAD(P)-dependent dehydrogenase (short-subunit alcohol dehydrogenase family)